MTFILKAQQDDAPVVGVSDRRIEVYGFKNARIYIDYQTVLENADIIVSKGRIEAVGQNLVFPKGSVITDLTGKTIYPSFIDVYAGNYGIKSATQARETSITATGRRPDC
jgi:imidazolonepropionase-like amidohydrolase